MKEYGQLVIPIFYDLSHSNVSKQTEEFGHIFERTCEKRTENEMQLWREALTDVANVLGYHSNNWSNEAKMIEAIANDILDLLKVHPNSQHLVSEHSKLMSNTLKFEVTRFDGSGNFGLWQRQMKDMLIHNGLEKTLLEEKPEAITRDDWDEMQEKTSSLIRLCLADEVVYQVIDDLKTSKEIWDKLEKMYMSKSLSSKLYLKQRLYGLKMSEGSDFVQHVIMFNQITEDLRRVDVKIKDEDKAMILLCSLTPSYKTFLTALTYDKETISVESVTNALLTHHNRRQQHIGCDRFESNGHRRGEDKKDKKDSEDSLL